MLNGAVNGLTNLLKLAPRYLVILAVFSGAPLFAPKEFLERLALLDFAENYRHWLGPLFLFSTVAVGVWGGGWLAGKARRWFGARQLQKLCLQRLRVLTEKEKQILRFYLVKQTRCNFLGCDDGVVNGLEANGVIYRAANTSQVGLIFAYNIHELAWQYLNQYPSVLDGETDRLHTDSVRWEDRVS
jgi:hypothetical protein